MMCSPKMAMPYAFSLWSLLMTVWYLICLQDVKKISAPWLDPNFSLCQPWVPLVPSALSLPAGALCRPSLGLSPHMGIPPLATGLQGTLQRTSHSWGILSDNCPCLVPYKWFHFSHLSSSEVWSAWRLSSPRLWCLLGFHLPGLLLENCPRTEGGMKVWLPSGVFIL